MINKFVNFLLILFFLKCLKFASRQQQDIKKIERISQLFIRGPVFGVKEKE
jgi:hypothetical protein